MEIKQLKTFHHVAHTLNFSRAAQEMNYAQPTVTAHIQTLEQELGVVLFNRLGKQVLLTPAGEKLAAYADQLLSLAQEAQTAVVQLGQQPMGELRIGASDSILAYHLPPLLPLFQERNPAVRLVLNPVHYADLVTAVKDGKLDIALAYRETVEPGLQYQTLLEEQLALTVSPAHRLAAVRQIQPDDLADEVLLTTSPTCPYRAVLQRILDQHRVQNASSRQFNSTAPIKQFARHGGGVTLLPAPVVADEVAQGNLVALDLAEKRLAIPLVMVWRPDKWESAALTSLKAFLAEVFMD